MFTELPAPSKLNACPTFPDVNVAPPAKVPSLPSVMSLAVPSAGHQLTSPDGGSTHVCAPDWVGAARDKRRKNPPNLLTLCLVVFITFSFRFDSVLGKLVDPCAFRLDRMRSGHEECVLE